MPLIKMKRYTPQSSRPATVQKFELLEQLSDVENQIRVRLARTRTNIASVAYSVEENQGLSIPCRSLEWIAL